MIGLSENVSQYVLFQLEKLSRAKFPLEKNIVSEEVRLLRTWSWVFLQFLCHCHLQRVLWSKDNYHCIKYQVKQRSLQVSWNFSGIDWIRTHISRILIGLNKQLGYEATRWEQGAVLKSSSFRGGIWSQFLTIQSYNHVSMFLIYNTTDDQSYYTHNLKVTYHYVVVRNFSQCTTVPDWRRSNRTRSCAACWSTRTSKPSAPSNFRRPEKFNKYQLEGVKGLPLTYMHIKISSYRTFPAFASFHPNSAVLSWGQLTCHNLWFWSVSFTIAHFLNN